MNEPIHHPMILLMSMMMESKMMFHSNRDLLANSVKLVSYIQRRDLNSGGEPFHLAP